MKKINWQGTHPKRCSHAFFEDTKAGEASLCGSEIKTSNGELFDKPLRTGCGRCLSKIKKLELSL